jgi:amino acid adenylation domain-containing protein
MKIDEYITRLRKENNIVISVADNDVKVRADEGSLTQEIIAAIRQRKPEILDFFSAARSAKPDIPVRIVSGDGCYRLSSVQKRLFFLQEINRASLAYNMPQGIRIEGELDLQKVEASFRKLIARHEALRTQFEMVEGELVQRVLEDPDFSVAYYTQDSSDVTETVQAFVTPFDLTRAPLIRVGVIASAEEKILLVDVHHIVSDGISNSILLREFLLLYNDQPLPALKLQYKDYAEWQQTMLLQEQAQKQRKFWIDTFSPLPAVIDLPYNFSRPLHKTYTGSSVVFGLDELQSAELRELAAQEHVTVFMLVLAVYNVLLSKLSNQEDIVVGTPTSGRFHEDVEATVGAFVNTIALRNQPRAELSFRDFLGTLKSNTLEAFDNQDWDYEMLVQDLQVDRRSSRNPLFDVFLTMQNFEQQKFSLPGMKLSRLKAMKEIAKFDLSLLAIEHHSGFTFEIEYAVDLFERQTIERWSGYFKHIIAAVIANSDISIADIDMVPQDERNLVLHQFNDTAAVYPRNKTITAVFEEQASRTPDNVALRFSDSCCTYRELRERADKIARFLSEVKGVKKGELVAILMERNEWLIPAIFGILKAGAVYVPVDPTYPAQRINTTLDDAGVRMVLTRNLSTDITLNSNCQLLDLDILMPAILSQPAGFENSVTGGKDLAYIIFTSGSTGKPKGVMIEHHAVINRLYWMQKQYPLQEDSVLLQKTPLVFDVSVWELFWWAFTGASLCLLEPGAEKEPERIAAAISAQGVTTIHFVPSMLSAFLSNLDGKFDFTRLRTLKQVFASGEELKAEHLSMFRTSLHNQGGAILVNLYGPTEATVDVTYYTCPMEENAKPVPIGKPIDNTRLYILNTDGRPAPIGVAGELYLAGVGLARGYLNNPELTAAKFVAHPFLKGERTYKTGDLARWTADGNVEFLGRIDNQVKVRGIRIEPGEIEHQLLAWGRLKEVAVIARERAGDKLLVAYYRSDDPVDEAQLRDFLAGQLPYYMIPAAFVRLEHMPLTINGKLDRKALPDPAFAASAGYTAPANRMEEQLVTIWAANLHLEKDSVGVLDNFFAIGGHSIMAHRLIYAINSTCSTTLTLRDIFEHPTIRELARLIGNSNDSLPAAVERAAEQLFYPASAAQRRLYYEQLRQSDSLAYNITGAYKLEGQVDIDKLQQAFQYLVNRHESLRTGLFIVDEAVVQQIAEDVVLKILTLDPGEYRDVPSALAAFVKPHDLSRPPLMRVGILQHGELGNLLLIDIHHIVCDGISLNILMNEFKSVYKGDALKQLPYRYIDYAAWQLSAAGEYASQREYWRRQLSGEIPVPDLPVSTNRDEVTIYAATSSELLIDGALYARIREFTAGANVSEFMFLISVYYILLAKVSGNSDIIIGSDAVGRNRPEFRDIVGTFVNELPLRMQVDNTLAYDELLAGVKECVLSAYDNQDFQFDEMLSLINREQHEKLIHVHFSYANFLDSEVQVDQLEFITVDTRKERRLTQYELKVEVYPNKGHGLRLAFVYSNELYEQATIQILMRYYLHILCNILNNPHARIADINMKAS